MKGLIRLMLNRQLGSIKWLGFKPDEKIVFQSNRLNTYKKYLKHLLKMELPTVVLLQKKN